MSTVLKSDSMATHSMVKCIKNNIKHGITSEKSKKRKIHFRSNSPDDDIGFKIKKHKAEEAKTETPKSKKRDRSRSKHRSRSPKCDKKPRLSFSHSSRDSEKIDVKKRFKINRNNFPILVPQRVLSAGDSKKESTAKIPNKTLEELTVQKKDKGPEIKPVSCPISTVVLVNYQDPHLSAVEPSAFTNTHVHDINSLLTNETGKLTGQIGTKVLSPAVLSSENQSLVSKDQIKNAASVDSSIGIINGEGLGKKQSESLETVSLDVKRDKRGLKKRWIKKWKNMDYQDPHASFVEPSAFTNTHVHESNSLLTNETGKLTGHIGTKVLSPAVLSSENQSLVSKDQIKNAASVNSSIGIINGEGLGKKQSESLETVSLDVATDKRGLVTKEKLQGNRTKGISKKGAKPILSIEGKNRIRVLYEICAKRKWERPIFDIVDESGPGHKKTFVIAVNVNGFKYTSSSCLTIKLAKLDAANACLKELLD